MKSSRRWKHPHVRGENIVFPQGSRQTLETPPRAWGKPIRTNNTCIQIQKHPHVRGENCNSVCDAIKSLETPPRAWGKQGNKMIAKPMARNTPTCVGKTKRLIYLLQP